MIWKGLTVVIILLFIGTCISPVIAQDVEKTSISSSRGNWLYVGGSGPGNYTTIQDAIDNSSDGDTVFVYDDLSPYREHLIILKSIIITGENKDTTEIFGIDKNKNLMTIKSSYVTVSDFAIRYGSVGFTGILIKDSSHITILDCKFSNIPSMDAVTVNNSENITIANCLMSDSLAVTGITLESGCINITISGNTISNASVAGILIVEGCQNIRTLNNIIFSNDGFGIDAWGCDSLYIKQNKIFNNFDIGIVIYDCNNTSISMNLCENNGFAAITIVDTMNTYIECNNFIKNRISGFFVFDYGKGFSNQYSNNNWNGNYWDSSWIFPKPILGVKIFNMNTNIPVIIIPGFVFDWHPAQEPYDIPGIT